MHFLRILKVLLFCGLVDAVARSFAYWGSSEIITGSLYAFLGLLFVGDSFYYILFAALFEVVASMLRRYNQSVWLYSGASLLLVLGLFFWFGSQRFFTSQQMHFMTVAYAVIGGLYGALYWRWVLLRQFDESKN
jgi:multidrug transporter EmrE-like cation transporter